MEERGRGLKGGVELMNYIERLLENEKDMLLDYLFSYCDNPLASASEDLQELFKEHDITDERDIRSILEDSYVKSYFPFGVPGSTDSSIWLDIGEIEVLASEIPVDCIDEFTVNGEYAYYYVGYGLMVEFHEEIIVADMCELSYPVKGFYSVVDYHDVWRYDDQWQVNDLSVVRDNVCIDGGMTDRELFQLFADIVGINKRLRAIEVVWFDEDFIELYYTANNDDYPLGRFQLNM